MRSTSNPRVLTAGLGLATLAGCIGELDVGKKPNDDLGQAEASAESSSDGEPGTTSSTAAGSTTGDETTDASTGEPSDGPPQCERSAAIPGSDLWSLACGGSQQERVHAITTDELGGIYVATRIEGQPPTTVLMGDDEIPSDVPPTLLVTKVSSDGEILWNRPFRGEEAWWEASSIASCDGRVYIAASRTGAPEPIDFGTGLVDGNLAVVALDSDDGQTQWAMATGQDDETTTGSPTGQVSCQDDGLVVQGTSAVDVAFDDIVLEGSSDTAGVGYVAVLDSDGSARWGAFEPTLTAAAALGPSGDLVTLGYGTEAAVLTRYGADGSLTWQRSFPTTGAIVLSSVAVTPEGPSYLFDHITIGGGFAGEIDLGLGALVNGDPPEDPLDPDDDLSVMDGFVSYHDPQGNAVWTTTLAETGYDRVSIPRVVADGIPEVLWHSPAGSRLVTIIGGLGTELAAFPSDSVLAIGGRRYGPIVLAWPKPSALPSFSPPLAARGGYDFTIMKLPT